MNASSLPRAGILGLSALLVSACSTPASPTSTAGPTLAVATGFYPLTFVAERVGGVEVAVTTLAPPGAEPHDLELSPAGVRGLREADIVLYLSGFQPSVDDAIASTNARALDATEVIDLLPGHDDDLVVDPHFWLDPTLLAEFGQALAEEFGALDPANAEGYRTNADALTGDLEALDSSFTSGLASCERDTILVSHEAFGYLAARYHLHQEGLSGIDPEAEPSPARVREVRELAASIGATTVFVETLVDPSVVEAFARDAGLAVATLDPVESATGGDDYLSIMARNLDALKTGLGCG